MGLWSHSLHSLPLLCLAAPLPFEEEVPRGRTGLEGAGATVSLASTMKHPWLVCKLRQSSTNTSGHLGVRRIRSVYFRLVFGGPCGYPGESLAKREAQRPARRLTKATQLLSRFEATRTRPPLYARDTTLN